MMTRLNGKLLALLGLGWIAALASAQGLPSAEPLTAEGDLAAAMVEGIDAYLMRALVAAPASRAQYWHRDYSSVDAYVASVAPNRERFRKYIGATDERISPRAEMGRLIAENGRYSVFQVTWPVVRGVHGVGLLLEPRGRVRASVVALPDCDWTPDQMVGLSEGVEPAAQFPRRLAERGYRVVVPLLIDRKDTFSGHPGVEMTNQPHREFVYRPAYQMGRHIIGYEVQKVLAAVDWLEEASGIDGLSGRQGAGTKEVAGGPVGVFGYGEGGLIALYAATVDTRIDACVVSGYFQPRESVWQEPIYRNVWGLLHEFGDAEIASLIAPRALIIEYAETPRIAGPPAVREGRSGAAPGVITTPERGAVEGEVARAKALAGPFGVSIQWVVSETGLPGNERTIQEFARSLGQPHRPFRPSRPSRSTAKPDGTSDLMQQQVAELMEDTQALVRESPYVRAAFWQEADRSSAEAFTASAAKYREYFRKEVIGELPPPEVPLRPRSRVIYDEPEYTGHVVVLDVYEDVFAYGILLVPKSLKEGERRPVVVCQHGLEGRPQDVANIHEDSPYYHAFAARLAQQGFVTFSPQNPYIGEDKFRVLQRKANPLKLSLFSFIVRQHDRILEWLGTLPFVDKERLAFYGLSYGGKTAMRVPAILPGYCLSICAGDFNEWIWKTTSNRSAYSYVFTGEYEMFEFDLGNTFNYGELGWLIFPRPFMVERGHDDGVAPDEWVAYEYARVRRLYDQFDLGDRTTLEFFNGPHTIHGVGTFEFLHKHLAFGEQ
ncbi:MAG: hypothetical protein HYV26_02830 [Candidatus Hydrogenedentes bacterium]|nr:hypothetical protein [Candidatus Hydrogenedentota bacterium]